MVGGIALLHIKHSTPTQHVTLGHREDDLNAHRTVEVLATCVKNGIAI